MDSKIEVGIIGSGGLIGRQYVRLLKNHPMFKLVFRSNRNTLYDFRSKKRYKAVFSALPSEVAKDVEYWYARSGVQVFSSASYHRLKTDTPLIIPEINSNHLDMIKLQQINNSWDSGFIVSKPNCTLQSYLLPLYPLHKKFGLKQIYVTNLQSISGAGSKYTLHKNIIPYIDGEEYKSEVEPLKILGEFDGKNLNEPSIKIYSNCVRVPVEYGHLSFVSASFTQPPTLREIMEEWSNFPPLNLPTSPKRLLIYLNKRDRPQPKIDCLCENGMAITIGRLRKRSPIFDISFVSLSHNLIRGGAGGGLLTAELYYKNIFFTNDKNGEVKPRIES